MWKNIVEPERTQTKIWRMRIPRWMPKVTNTLRIRDTYSFSSATMAAETAPRHTYSPCVILHYHIKGKIIGGKIIEQKCAFLFSLQLIS